MVYDNVCDANQLTIEYTSKASADQRKGRVGRTRKGFCYRLYTEAKYQEMSDYAAAEISRCSLVNVCLQTKAISPETSVEQFMIRTIEPPDNSQILAAVQTLKTLGAFDNDENLTHFGRMALKFPIDCRLVKALLFSIIFRCFEPVMRIVSMLSVKPPFVLGGNSMLRSKILEKKRFFAINADDGDLHFLHNIYQSLYGLQSNIYFKYEYCKENFISYAALREAKAIVESIKKTSKELKFDLAKSGFSYGAVNVNQEEWSLINACFVPAYYDNVSYLSTEPTLEEHVEVSSASILARNDGEFWRSRLKNWLIYGERSRHGMSPTVRVNKATIVSDRAVLLLGGQNMAINCLNGTISIDKAFPFEKITSLARSTI